MLTIVDLDTAKSADGLRLVLLKGVPSPWSQAAKAIGPSTPFDSPEYGRSLAHARIVS
jgi:hypothetical protein